MSDIDFSMAATDIVFDLAAVRGVDAVWHRSSWRNNTKFPEEVGPPAAEDAAKRDVLPVSMDASSIKSVGNAFGEVKGCIGVPKQCRCV